MDYRMTDDHRTIRASVMDLCQKFPPEYWRERDAKGGFPEDFYRAVAENGWLGIAIPEEYGGAGMNFTAAIIAILHLFQHGQRGVIMNLSYI